MRIYSGVLLVGATSLALVSAGCGGNTCGAGTHLVDSTCVPDDTDAGVPDLGGTSASCGTNTVLMGGACVVQSTVCGSGTMWDGMHCVPAGTNNGTLVNQSVTYTITLGLSYHDPNPPDGGAAYPPLTPAVIFPQPAGVTDSTPLYMAAGFGGTPDPFGAHPFGPVHWGSGNYGNGVLAIDHQITFGEWKKCSVTYSIYKNPPSGKKNYKVVYDATGCPGRLHFDVWGVYSTTDHFPDSVLSTPLGGMPAGYDTDDNGNGHFERELDPNIWFKSGVALEGGVHATGPTAGHIPDLSSFSSCTPPACPSFWVDNFVHNDGQTNGNSGYCEFDNTTNCNGGPCCKTPPSDTLWMPGFLGVRVAGANLGGRIPGDDSVPATLQPKPTPLSMLQPY